MRDASAPTPSEPRQPEGGPTQPAGLGARLFLGTAYSILFQGVNRLSGFLQSVIVARLVGRADFGVLALVMSSIQVFRNPLRAFEDNIVKFAAESQGERRAEIEKILGTGMVLLAAIAVAGWAICVGLAPNMTSGGEGEALSLADAARATSLVRLGSLQVLMQPLVVMATGVLGGLLLIDVVAKRNIGVRLILLIGSVLGAKFLGLEGVIWAVVVSEAAAVVVSCHLAHKAMRDHDLRLRVGDRRSLWELVRLAAPYCVTTLITGLGPWFSMLILSRHEGPGAAGSWRVALAFFAMAQSVSFAVASTSLPMTTHLLATDSTRLSAALTRVTRTSLWVNGGVAVLLVLSAFRLIPLFYGAEFAGAWPAAALLTVSTLTIAVRQPLFSYLLGSGQVLILLFTEAVGIGLFALSLWLGATQWGAVGVTWAYSGYLLLTLIPPLWSCVSRGNISLAKLAPIWAGTMAAAVGAAAIAFLLGGHARLLAAIPYGLVAVGGMTAGLARTDPEVIALVRERLRRPRAHPEGGSPTG